MALSEVIVSFDLNQILGADYALKGVTGYVKTNALNGRLEDTSTGEIRMGDQAVTINDDGTGTWTTWAPGPDGNPASWQEWFVVSHRSVANRSGRTTATFGPYTITGTSKTVSNKALTSNVATITTSTAHGLDVGNTVTIAGVDSTFNGTFTITAIPSSTTLSYAKTHADVASAAATGTLTSPNVRLTSLEDEQAIPAEYQTAFTEQAQAYLDAQAAIAGIDDTDSAVAALIEDELVGPLTNAALTTSIDAQAGPGSTTWIKAIGGDAGFAFTSISTVDTTTGLVTAGNIKWPDGRTGVFAGTVDSNYYTGFTATYVPAAGPTKTLTASGISYDTASGLPLGPTGLAVA